MIAFIETKGQQTFDVSGSFGFPQTNSVFTGLEGNPSNLFNIKDWKFSLVFGSEFEIKTVSNLYYLSISKKFKNNLITVRYSPGFEKEFRFLQNQVINQGDSSDVSLQSNLNYKELFGLGYVFNFKNKLNVGFSVRYFTQEFNQDILGVVFSDTLYLVRENKSEKINNWKIDFGFDYFLTNNFSLGLGTINLINLTDGIISPENEKYKLRNNNEYYISLFYQPIKNFGVNLIGETNNSFQMNLNNDFNLFNGKLNLSLTAFNDDDKDNFFSGMIPSLRFTNKNFGLSFSYVKYFSNRTGTASLNKFEEEGISNVIHNKFSFDKAILSLHLLLNTKQEKYVQFVDVKIVNDIYPTFVEEYIVQPFAIAKVVNLSDRTVTVKPASKIEKLNYENIFSPFINISPKDTIEIPFYTMIQDSYLEKKSIISYANFYLITENENPDDEIQKPILINGINAWNGNVSYLRYFVKKDFDFSLNYSKNILSKYKTTLDTIRNDLENFYKTKILFNEVMSKMIYVADPNSSTDRVQFPNETIQLKGGDCDDLSVCFSSLLESIGIETAFVDYQAEKNLRHVNLLINTKLNPEKASFITKNDKKFFVRKNVVGEEEVWIPIETTSLTDFDKAWEIAADKFYSEAIDNYGLSKGSVQIINVF